MKRLLLVALLCWTGAIRLARAEDDFLDDGEVAAIRDAQEPDKRMILWMDFAQRRVDAVKQAQAAAKPDAGRAIQKTLVEYVRILEALDDTIQDARERRVPLSKGLKDVTTRGNLYLNYLRTLDSEAIPAWKDYKYTLEEAMNMTRDEIAEAAKGAYPEVKERKPPADLPPPSSRPPAGSQSGSKAGEEQGPPRKSRPSQ